MNPVTTNRLPALDWMRGFVMLLMVTDHASSAYNAQRPWQDTAHFYDGSAPLDALQFLVRWVSHLCAPAFLVLAGAALAISIERKLARGATSKSIDRDLLTRGLIIASVDVLIISWIWIPGSVLLQVMYVIGMSLILMIPMRRLGSRALLAMALLVIGGAELFYSPIHRTPNEPGPILNAMALNMGTFSSPLGDTIYPLRNISVFYPVLPWWGLFVFGWVFGRALLAWQGHADRDRRAVRSLTGCGIAGLMLFALVRGLNGYGNCELLRADSSLVEWLHVSKYPPSISFIALEGGLVALSLAGFFRLQQARGGAANPNGPLLVFGQTAFFFYVVHILLFEGSALILGMRHAAGLPAAAIAGALALPLLYGLCLRYRRLKAAHPKSLLRYL